MARPVSPPPRPESISVDHHDPYLVNYRGEPFPIRIGPNSSQSADCALQPLAFWVAQLGSGVSTDCEISRQKTDAVGDMAHVLVSGMHGDPVVPILNSFDGDTLQFRLIQGAQEVQHTFNVEGNAWPRNIDQRFPSMMRELEDITLPTTLVRACYEGAGVQSALLDPRGLIRPDAPGAVTEDALNEPANWVGIPRSRIIAAIRARYDRPEPLVLNVKAGDCVNITLLNALSFEGKAADPARQDMRDRPGDAEMPGITSINVDPRWSGVKRPGHGVPIDVTQIRDIPSKEVRPSARLAVMLPLPVVTRQSAIGRPYGQNPVLALDGVRGADPDPLLDIRNPVVPDQMAQIELFEFYAGLAWGRRPGAAVAPDLVLRALPPEVLNLPVTVGAAQSLGDVVEAVRTGRVGIARDLAARVLDGLDVTLGAGPALRSRIEAASGRRLIETDFPAPLISLAPIGGTG